MFTSVLVGLRPASQQQFVVDYAVATANGLKAELTACIVIDEDQISPPEAVPLGAGAFKHERDVELLAAARAEAERLMHQCQSTATAAGVACIPRQFEGDVVEVLARESHERDLLIVGRDPANELSDESRLYRILRSTPRPAIVCPARPVAGDSVVVAYDGSRQAAQILASFAHSGLGVGRTIYAACFDDKVEYAAERCEIACRFLSRYGLIVEPHADKLTGSPAQALTKLAIERSAGLLVLGAFGRSAWRELIFGSTTRRVLHDMPLPVFVDH